MEADKEERLAVFKAKAKRIKEFACHVPPAIGVVKGHKPAVGYFVAVYHKAWLGKDVGEGGFETGRPGKAGEDCPAEHGHVLAGEGFGFDVGFFEGGDIGLKGLHHGRGGFYVETGLVFLEGVVNRRAPLAGLGLLDQR